MKDLPMADITPFHAWSGSRFIDMRDPQPEDFILDEIARGLSRENRYGGAATSEPWNVGQHLILAVQFAVEDGVPKEDVRVILAHDFPEYMLRDVIRPMKQTLPDYKALEALWWSRMATRFNLPFEMPAVVHEYDLLVAACEKREFISDAAGAWPGLPITDRPIPVWLRMMSDYEVEEMLLDLMQQYGFC